MIYQAHAMSPFITVDIDNSTDPADNYLIVIIYCLLYCPFDDTEFIIDFSAEKRKMFAVEKLTERREIIKKSSYPGICETYPLFLSSYKEDIHSTHRQIATILESS
jgi:hypothetical protein